MRLLSIVLVAALALPALAKSRSAEKEVDRLSNEALEAYRRGDYDKSVSLLERAYKLHADPTLLYNMGKAEEMRGNREKARARYRAFVAAPAGDAKLKAKAKAALKRMEEAETAPAPTATTTTETAKTPAPAATATAPEPATTAPPAASAPVATATAPTPAPTPTRTPTARRLRVAPRQEWISGAVIAVVGLGAIGGGAALYANVVSLHSQLAGVPDDGTLSNETAKRDLVSRATARAAASTALYVVGGVLAAGGGALLAHGLLRQRRERAASAARTIVAPLVGAGEVGLCVARSF